MKKYILLSSLFTLLVIPGVSSAYTTSEQTAVQIDETTALYSITYSFGLKSNDLYMPREVVRDQNWKESTSTLGFVVLEDSKRLSAAGSAAGVVLSDAKVTTDGLYYIPAGHAATFTLYVILQTQPTDLEADYAIRVTDLPFLRGDEREHLYLNPSELQYYQTPETEFNESNPSRD